RGGGASAAVTVTIEDDEVPRPYREHLDKVYRDLLGRDLDPVGLEYWGGLLAEGGGSDAAVERVVGGILSSDEWRMNHVVELYHKLFDRAPNPQELQDGMAFLADDSVEELTVRLVCAPE